MTALLHGATSYMRLTHSGRSIRPPSLMPVESLLMKIRPLLIPVVALAGFAVTAALAAADKPDAARVVQAALEKSFPDVSIVGVEPAPVAGLYEVFTGSQIVYADAQGKYLISGTIIDTESKRDLTAERYDIINSIEFDRLPLERAIKTVKGSGKRSLAVFSDPDCPYCKELEKQLDSLTDVTIYTFLYPLADLHPEAPRRARAIWCAENRSQVWREWMVERRLPEDLSCQTNVIDENVKLGRELRISATPTIYGPNGRRLSGSYPLARIKALLDETAPAAPKPVEAKSRSAQTK
jgi:thiol:disulfide interchange protein DsbC